MTFFCDRDQCLKNFLVCIYVCPKNDKINCETYTKRYNDIIEEPIPEYYLNKYGVPEFPLPSIIERKQKLLSKKEKEQEKSDKEFNKLQKRKEKEKKKAEKAKLKEEKKKIRELKKQTKMAVKRKQQISLTENKLIESPAIEMVLPKKRGRKPKNTSANIVIENTIEKKRRGRPKKVENNLFC